jgi:hypothetical protein
MRSMRFALCFLLSLVLVPIGAASAANVKAKALTTISGTITDAATGLPVANAQVVAYVRPAVGAEWGYYADITTDVDGSYSLEVEPGSFRVGAQAEYSQMVFYDGATSLESATDVTMVAGGSRTIDMAVPVSPMDGSITGRITDGTNPLPGFAATAVRLSDKASFSANAASDGSYTIANLPEGDYKVQFADESWDYSPMWNGGALWQDSAATITVGATPVTSDAVMSLGGSINGTLSVQPAFNADMPFGGTEVALFRHVGSDWVQLDPGSFSETFPQVTPDGPQDGTYSIIGIPAGTYRVRFAGNEIGSRFWPSVAATDPAAPGVQDVVVTGGSTQDLGTNTAPQAGQISIHVVDPYGRPVFASAGVYRITDDPDWIDTAFVNWQSDLSEGPIGGLLHGLDWYPTTSTGDYRVLVSTPMSTAYREQWVGGGTSYATAGSVHVADGQTTSVTVRLRYVLPFASLKTPSAPSSVRHGRTFSVIGTMTKHRAGTSAVKLYFYRSEKQRNRTYAWVLRKSLTAKIATSGSASKYTVKLSLPSAGKWRVQAYHADSGHAPSYSGFRNITVK